MARTSLSTLADRHDKQAAAKVKKTLDNINWQINPNDICWIYHWPQVQKQLGRSKRVFYKLTQFNNV